MNETETERLLREAVNLLANALEILPADTAASEIITDWLDAYVGICLDPS